MIGNRVFALIAASSAFFSIVLVKFSIPSLLPYLINERGMNAVMRSLVISALRIGCTVFSGGWWVLAGRMGTVLQPNL